MKKTKVLVLGGNGFIGSNLCNFLVKKNIEVFSFDINYPKIMNKNINYIQGDFFDDESLLSAINDIDFIYHAISTIIPGNSNERYMNGYGKDFMQTIKLCELIKDTKTKMIFLSSGGTVYGRQEIQPIKESAMAQPINHYGNVKLCIENTIRIFNLQLHTKNLIARIANPYGPGQDYTKGVGFIDAAIKNMLNGHAIEIWGDGNIIRDYIYIDDVCEMLYFLMHYNGGEEVFNISSNVGVSQNQIIEILKELHGESNVNVIYKEARSVDVPQIILDNKKIIELNKNEIYNIHDGINAYYNFILNCSESKDYI